MPSTPMSAVRKARRLSSVGGMRDPGQTAFAFSTASTARYASAKTSNAAPRSCAVGSATMRASNSRKLSRPSKIPLCKHACDLEWVGDVIIAGSFAFWMERAVSVKTCSGQVVAQFENRRSFLAEVHCIRAAPAVANVFLARPDTGKKQERGRVSARVCARARAHARAREAVRFSSFRTPEIFKLSHYLRAALLRHPSAARKDELPANAAVARQRP